MDRLTERAEVLKRYGREALLKFGYTMAELDEAQAILDGRVS